MQQSREFYGKGSLADELDFALFESDERREARQQARKEAIRQAQVKKNREKQAAQAKKHSKTIDQPKTIFDRYGRFNVIAVISIAVMFIVLLAIMVANQQKVNDITNDIKDKTDELTVLEQDYEVMRITFESKMSDAAIEQYAIEVLGMQHRENNQTEYLNIDNVDIFEDCEGKRSSIFFWNNN